MALVRHDASSASCHVYTYKEGLLSAVAHDLALRVTQLSLEIDEEAGSVRARFDARSLRVESVMVDGRARADVLTPADYRKIEATLADEVLEARRFPEIRFDSTSVRRREGGADVAGRLLLHGVERALAITARLEGERYTASLRLHQPDFGIRPYRAMLGTLKVQADVTVSLSVPRQGR